MTPPLVVFVNIIKRDGSYCYIFLITVFYFYVCVCVCVCVHGGRRTPLESVFSASRVGSGRAAEVVRLSARALTCRAISPPRRLLS